VEIMKGIRGNGTSHAQIFFPSFEARYGITYLYFKLFIENESNGTFCIMISEIYNGPVEKCIRKERFRNKYFTLFRYLYPQAV
jgi:hypothetical protein